MSEDMQNIQDKIWVTSRIRMGVEQKIIYKNNLSMFIITYYSLFSIILSIFSDFYKEFYIYYDNLLISFSVVILSSSLYLTGGRIENKAGLFRQCYLLLQKIHEEECDLATKKEKYHDVLSHYPNHTSNDYYTFLLKSCLFKGEKIKNGGVVQNLTYFIIFYIFLKYIICFLFVILLMGLPIAFCFFPIFFLIW